MSSRTALASELHAGVIFKKYILQGIELSLKNTVCRGEKFGHIDTGSETKLLSCFMKQVSRKSPLVKFLVSIDVLR